MGPFKGSSPAFGTMNKKKDLGDLPKPFFYFVHVLAKEWLKSDNPQRMKIPLCCLDLSMT